MSERANAGRDGVGELLRGAGPRPAAPSATMAHSREVVRAAWRAELRRRRARRWTVAAAAAVAGVALAAGLLAGRLAPARGAIVATVERLEGGAATASGAPLGAGSPVRAGDEIVTAADARLALAFAGGRSLRLDRGTAARLGEGGAPGDPARIRTLLGEAVEHGTQFEVRLADTGVELRVREGEVDWIGRSGSERVSAGTGLLVAPRGAMRPIAVERAGETWAWTWMTVPPFELEGTTLAEFLAWFERESGRPARLTPGAAGAAGVRLHGELPELSPESTIELVARSSGLSAWREGDGWIVGGSAP